MRRIAFAAGMAFITTAVLLQRGHWWAALITALTTAVCVYVSIVLDRA
jgi:uncharacterized membrane protein YjjP (DUF1212 family)